MRHIRKIDEKEGLVGFVLFDTVKRTFVSFRGGIIVYTGNVEEVCVADIRTEALDIMISPDELYDVKIVPLICNKMFGLSPKSRVLDNDKRSDHKN
ncbi:TPA: hypothetical protein R4D26_000909 [Salmonella enterica subsp. enterica serovar Stanley]|nr:hypothetical protein [Salmonella enterica subsp. enterica serovar Stanley]